MTVLFVTMAVSGLGWASSCFTWYSDREKGFHNYEVVGGKSNTCTHRARWGRRKTWRSPSSRSRPDWSSSRRRTSSSQAPPRKHLGRMDGVKGMHWLRRGQYRSRPPCSRWSFVHWSSRRTCRGFCQPCCYWRPLPTMVSKQLSFFADQFRLPNLDLWFRRKHLSLFCDNISLHPKSHFACCYIAICGVSASTMYTLKTDFLLLDEWWNYQKISFNIMMISIIAKCTADLRI